MVKVIFLLKFRDDLDPESVRQWWRTAHGALALKNREMVRYVQNHFVEPLDAERAPGGNPFDGVVEVWFEDRAAYERTMSSPEWRALEDDGPNGFSRVEMYGGFVTEHVMRWDALPDARTYTAAGTVPPGSS